MIQGESPCRCKEGSLFVTNGIKWAIKKELNSQGLNFGSYMWCRIHVFCWIPTGYKVFFFFTICVNFFSCSVGFLLLLQLLSKLVRAVLCVCTHLLCLHSLYWVLNSNFSFSWAWTTAEVMLLYWLCQYKMVLWMSVEYSIYWFSQWKLYRY